MSPVSTTNDPTIGYTGKLGNGLGFDPIAARNPDRPKFRLDDYNEATEPRETKPSHATSNRSERDPKIEDTRDHRQTNNATEKQTGAAGATAANATQDKADTKQTNTKVQTSAAETNTTETNTAEANTAETNTAETNTAETNTAETNTAETNTAETKNSTSADNAGSVKKPVKDQPTDTSTPYAEGATDENAAGAADAPLSAEAGVTAPSTQTEGSAPEVIATSVPEPKVAQASSTTAAAVGNKPDNAITDDAQEQLTAATAEKNTSQKATATPAATTSRDPKLAALEKLTQTGQSTAATTQSAVSVDDTTTFKLPVPWPPQAQSDASQDNKGAPGQTTAASQKAVNQSQVSAPIQTNQATMATAQTASVPADAEIGRPDEGSKQAAISSATKTARETIPKIEIVSQTPAKPAAVADTVLIANNRTSLAEGSVKQTALPTPSETIAAATALNSRPAQSNALGGSNVKRSNAVTASNENTGNGAKAAAGQGQPNPAIISQTSQTNPATAAVTAVAQGQVTASTPEQLASVRQQSSSTQRAQADPTGTTSSTSRAADLPAQGTSSGFADSLRTASADRMAATQDRQTLPTPATEQVKVKLIKAAQGGLDKIKIQLNPSELGKVEVRLEIGSDGAIRGTVIADKPETMELLQRDAKQLERALQDAGLKTGGDSLDFQMRGGGTNERQQHAGSGNGPLSQDGGDLDGSDEQPATDTTGSEHDGIGDDGSLNLVA